MSRCREGLPQQRLGRALGVCHNRRSLFLKSCTALDELGRAVRKRRLGGTSYYTERFDDTTLGIGEASTSLVYSAS